MSPTQSTIAETIVYYTHHYVSPKLASHWAESLDSPATVTTIVVLLGGATLGMSLAPPLTYCIRRFRNFVKFGIFFAMVYRFVTILVLPSYAIDHDLFDYVVAAQKFCHDTIQTYADLHLPAKLSKALVTCFRDTVGLAMIGMVLGHLTAFRRTSFAELKDDAIESAFGYAKMLPMVKKELAKEEAKMEKDLIESLKDPKRKVTDVLPKKGRTAKSLTTELKRRGKKEDKKWQEGLVSGCVYNGDEEHTELMNAAYAAFSLSNPLHPDIWPSVNQFEAEVCAMTCSMVNGGKKEVVGCMTSGGTESIILCTKAHREFYRKEKGITKPEIISCTTAHAAIDKACEILSIRSIKVGTYGNTYKIDLKAVEAAITPDTIMLYSSAPSFPQGVIDNIAALSKLAIKYDIGLHVDCCLGGFVLPFAKKAGYDIPEFDFSLPGVSSMSCDTHKYGYAAKGTSIAIYKNKALRRAQYFYYPSWTGGLYTTPTIAGSRPGALSACCWASMVAMGEDGYTERVKLIMDTCQEIAEEVKAMPGLELFGVPKSMIVCFGSKQYNIYRVSDKMAKLGWSLNTLQKPACVHLCVTLRTCENPDKFVKDLRDCVDEVIEEGNDVALSGNAAIYGMSGSMPPGPVNELLGCYTDTMLMP